MARFKLTLEYDGAPFVGWQRQDNGPSVQAALEDALRALTGRAVEVVGAGRTDAGVHALGQVAHIDLADERFDGRKLREALNYHLKPAPIAVLAAAPAPADFHARFSATARAYLYVIVNRRAPLAIDRGRAWQVRQPLDVAAMAAAAEPLLGHHDFTSFRAAQCQAKSPCKTLDRLTVTREGDEIHIEAGARSFLHHQVRNIVGTLKWVGEGKWTAREVAAALAARDRTAAGPTAPADGLYLVSVAY
ncbi:MAG: tRNA pseudouridine(38-40) synthase TruA [Pseudomonadota bacterium]|nr:tRNA pseudouridine(38-40) synthase TruA [Pseudomonadota bacterium]